MTPLFELLADASLTHTEPPAETDNRPGWTRDIAPSLDQVLVEGPAEAFQFDVPYVMGQPLILSQRAWSLLENDASPGSKAYPVRRRRPDLPLQPIPFVGVFVAPVPGLFDLEASEWEPHRMFPELVGEVSTLVLQRPPPCGFFSMPECRGRYLVTPDTRDKLLAAGLKGLAFKPFPRLLGT